MGTDFTTRGDRTSWWPVVFGAESYDIAWVSWTKRPHPPQCSREGPRRHDRAQGCRCGRPRALIAQHRPPDPYHSTRFSAPRPGPRVVKRSITSGRTPSSPVGDHGGQEVDVKVRHEPDLKAAAKVRLEGFAPIIKEFTWHPVANVTHCQCVCVC